jgi:hypothetical protein
MYLIASVIAIGTTVWAILALDSCDPNTLPPTIPWQWDETDIEATLNVYTKGG